MPLEQCVRSGLVVAACALLAVTACLPPIAWHDGLPAWSPGRKDVEWRVGYHRLSGINADTFSLFGERFVLPDYIINYVTPGVRWGLANEPLAADAGFASVVALYGGGLGFMVGPAFGLGRCDTSFSVMFRPSLYMFSLGIGTDNGGLEWTPWYQLELLLGNGYRAKGVNFAAGGRASPMAAGLVGVLGLSLHPLDLRTEVSYMWPAATLVTGRALTLGLTAAAPTKR